MAGRGTGRGAPRGRVDRENPGFTRPALAPALIAAVVMMATVGLLNSDIYYVVRFIGCILTAIVAWYAIRGSRPLWLVGLIPIIVFLNPMWPVNTWEMQIPAEGIFSLTMLAPVILVAAGATIRVPTEDTPASRSARR